MARTTWVNVAIAVFAVASTAGQDVPLRPEKALKWRPPAIKGAALHARIPYLQPEREWERMDVWVPQEPDDGPLPCVVAVYGGGYGEKNLAVKDFRPLVSRGFVVAAPDYALKANTPVPLCSWDVANAIRFLRAHAARFRIDPERIGIWGWSAGGWIAQDLCYAGPERIVTANLRDDAGKKHPCLLPMLQPRPQYPEQSVRLQAVVSDWGAGKLWDRREKTPVPWLSPDDPPLFTCYAEARTDETVNPVVLLRRLGVPARGVYGLGRNTHVPDLRTPCVHEDGRRTTWGESIYDFLERALKNCDTATAPEMRPHGGLIDGPTAVRLLTAHSAGTIHYTLDGSTPTADSPRYAAPVTVRPGQTLKAIAVRPLLQPSRVTAGTFAQGPPRPRITTKQQVYHTRVG